MNKKAWAFFESNKVSHIAALMAMWVESPK